MASEVSFKGYCWCLGTTSFRTKNFNKTIEEQLSLLDQFWDLEQNKDKVWKSNSRLQESYYAFMLDNEFIYGQAKNKAKDAREKTSGLVELGLVDSNRHLTEAGKALLQISRQGNFKDNNIFQIDKDSFIYFKQLLKTSINVNGNSVRPLIVLAYLLVKLDYLSSDEFAYLLPLCIDLETTDEILSEIENYRLSNTDIDTIIINRLLGMENYKKALRLFMKEPVSEDLICKIGMNRKSRKYDIPYFRLYSIMFKVFIENDLSCIYEMYEIVQSLKLKRYWNSLLFIKSTTRMSVRKKPQTCLKDNSFFSVQTEKEFRYLFFKYLHLFKVKATLADYFDLNRRYFKTTDIFIFEEDRVSFDLIPKYYFLDKIEELYQEAFLSLDNDKLHANCSLKQINKCLEIDRDFITQGLQSEFGCSISNITDAQILLEKKKYERFNKLIDEKFSIEQLVQILRDFEERNDQNIQNYLMAEADVPTIFEYVLGVIWYLLSGKKGRILDYMKLSLDGNLLPKTHAAGGEADIVYEYVETDTYPAHDLLLEATLSDKNGQRRMEMEPVSRHLGNCLLRTRNMNTYCVFVTTNLNINVVSDFRSRKNSLYYDYDDVSNYVDGMKIIPIDTSDLIEVLKNEMTYEELYKIFDEAHNLTDSPAEWRELISQELRTSIS